ncbi:SDR family oxidoreductase [Arenibacterium halophilum]|uniref:SDR family oxidoreductase n=1 Tax=Arenibacterium halophilum TaxID=2583821 RepID=A0ABY2XFA7_9RHOB|nr:SDR family oxidoreductase [Arenibacterium halophilum]TMV15272.1 SDR family oxidoreductase [Arenibacterium halophilum]
MSQSIIITGAGIGIGRATARAFLQAGWNVGLVGRRVEALEEAADGHAAARIMPCDVCEEDAVEGAFGRVAAEWGRLDVLFNNAGVSLKGAPIDEIAIGDWRRVIETNLTGSFIAAQTAFALMRRQDPQGGRIINNGSISAHAPRVGSAAYTASKHAITGLTRSISLDGRPFNIACGQIDIGNALTEMTLPMTQGMPQPNGAVEVEPVMDVEDVARSVLHMATMPEGANVQFMTVMATNMPFIGRG